MIFPEKDPISVRGISLSYVIFRLGRSTLTSVPSLIRRPESVVSSLAPNRLRDLLEEDHPLLNGTDPGRQSTGSPGGRPPSSD